MFACNLIQIYFIVIALTICQCCVFASLECVWNFSARFPPGARKLAIVIISFGKRPRAVSEVHGNVNRLLFTAFYVSLRCLRGDKKTSRPRFADRLDLSRRQCSCQPSNAAPSLTPPLINLSISLTKYFTWRSVSESSFQSNPTKTSKSERKTCKHYFQ